MTCFSARRRLGNTPFVKTSRLLSDSGLLVGVYAGQEYLMIEFVLEVTEWAEVSYVE